MDNTLVAPDNTITFTMVNGAGNELTFKMNRTKQFNSAMKNWCERMDQKFESVRFVFDGNPIKPTDTPEGLGMDEGDRIDVMIQQTGGCYKK